jgi:hypothetical protein
VKRLRAKTAVNDTGQAAADPPTFYFAATKKRIVIYDDRKAKTNTRHFPD